MEFIAIHHNAIARAKSGFSANERYPGVIKIASINII